MGCLGGFVGCQQQLERTLIPRSGIVRQLDGITVRRVGLAFLAEGSLILRLGKVVHRLGIPILRAVEAFPDDWKVQDETT